MFISFNQLKKYSPDDVRYSFREPLAELGWLSGLPGVVAVTGDVVINLNAGYNQKRIYLAGEVKAAPVTECNRCLARFNKAINLDFSEILAVELFENRLAAARLLEDYGEEEVLPLNGERIDLTELFRQILLAGQDWTKLLCSEDCRGICAECGTDNNKTDCQCKDEDNIDPRWAKLRNLK